MKILEFTKLYPDEESCKQAFKQKREEEGVRCKKCGHTQHYWKKNREQWECKRCGHRTTIRSGTVMEHSKLPFRYWFFAMHLMTTTKKSFSAKELQRQLGHKRYQPIWEMLHKLRSVMGLRDQEYQLHDEIELDEGFFSTVDITRDKNEPLKRGRGSKKMTKVLVSAESLTVEDEKLTEKYRIKKKLRFIKMQVFESYKADKLQEQVEQTIFYGTYIRSDNSTSYVNLKEHYEHQPETKAILPWVHTMISNAKRLLLDVHHRIDNDFLQNYLNEYCFKLNRRYFDDIFDRLLIAAVSYRWDWLGEPNG